VDRPTRAPVDHENNLHRIAGLRVGADGEDRFGELGAAGGGQIVSASIDGAWRAFEVAGRGCLVRLGEDEPRYATAAEIAARFEPHPDATMLLTAVSEAVERYDPSREAAMLLEIPSGYQVLILSPEGYDYVGGLTFEGYGLLACAEASSLINLRFSARVNGLESSE
jgi:hypothetical protein